MPSESISYLKNPECLQIKIELSKLKKLHVELINLIVDDYVNNCCSICKSDREYNGFYCYVCKDSDKCGNVCTNYKYNPDLEPVICEDCLRHCCSGRGPLDFCYHCEGFYCTGEKGCRSMRECGGCDSVVCNSPEHNYTLTCAFCDRFDCANCGHSDFNVVQCPPCEGGVCKDCGIHCPDCGYYCCDNPSCFRICMSCGIGFCTSCYPLNKSLCNDCESSL